MGNKYYGEFFLALMLAIFAGYIGSKKRIGTNWAFFISIFAPILGLLAAILSPPKSNIPKDNPKDKPVCLVFGIIFSLLAVGAFVQGIKLYNDQYFVTYEIQTVFYKFWVGGGLTLFSVYLFQRSKRNQQAYFDSNISKNEEAQNNVKESDVELEAK